MYISGVDQKRGILFIDDNFASLEKINPLDDSISNIDRDFHFKFYFNVSQTRIIKENAFSIIVSLRTKNKQVPLIVQNVINNEVDSNKLINNILTNKNQIKMQNSLEESCVLIEKVVDITSKIDNVFLTALRSNAVDESQFAKTKVLVRKKNDVDNLDIDQLSETEKNKILFSRLLFDDLSVIKSKFTADFISIKQRFQLLNSSISPSTVSFTSNKVMSPYASITGCIPVVKKNFANDVIDLLSFFHHSQEIVDVNLKQQKNDYETVIEKTFDDLIKVNLDLTLKESNMFFPSIIAEFKLVKRVVDSKKQIQQIVVETVEKRFDMKEYFNNFMLNQEPLSVGVSKINQQVILQIKNNGASCIADVYGKNIKNFNNSSFFKVGSVALDSKNKMSFVMINNTDNDAIYRVVSVNVKTKKMSNDFTDVVIKNQRNINNNVNVLVIPQLSAGKVYIKIINNSYNFDIVACKVLYKNLTKKETNYTISSIETFSFGTKEYSCQLRENIIPYNVYEITTKLIFENGVEVFSSNKNLIQTVPYLGKIINAQVSDISTVGGNVTFNLNAALLPDQTSQISDLLGQVSARYDTTYYRDKGAEFDKFVAFQILRYNLLNGDCEDLGIIVNNSNFSDATQSSIKGAESPVAGVTYRYIINTLLRDPETITETQKSFIDQETKKPYTVNLRKSRHPLTLSRGSILSKFRIEKDVTPDMLYGIIGDSIQVEVIVGPNVFPSISNFKANFLNRKKAILSWRIKGDISSFDHILIFKEDRGIRTIIGKSHCLQSNLDFIYNLTPHDVGNLRFILEPIHKDYSTGKSIMSNYLLINDVE
jgi:hypothetical protein